MRALLFDFFGTLVEFDAGRHTDQATRAHALAAAHGYTGTLSDLDDEWESHFVSMEAESRATLVEFSMTDVADRFLASNPAITGLEPAELGATYVRQWSEHVVPIDGVAEMLERLASEWAIAVVSNTHDADMVPRMLAVMGLADVVDVTLLSVDHGRAKPHPSIYEAALLRLGAAADECVFIGDSLGPDHTGPTALGMRALLIDPDGHQGVPEVDRIGSVLDVEERVQGW